MHHGNEFTDKIFRDIVDQAQLGATGKYPEGKLTDDDEGEIRIAVGESKGKVVITFGKPTAWIGFSPEQAISIASSLLDHAEYAKKGAQQGIEAEQG